MQFLSIILPYIQVFVSVILIAVILVQQRGAGLSGVFGGGLASYYTKRGFEKILFIATIILAVLFIVSNFLGLLI